MASANDDAQNSDPRHRKGQASSGKYRIHPTRATADDLKTIDGVINEFTVHGGRMNEQQMLVVEQ
jgi:hypothetical protein